MTTAQLGQAVREFRRLADPYYWLTAYFIAQNAITRQYRNSFLGLAWTVLNPLMQVLIFWVVMPLIMRFPVENYIVYLVVSYPLWNFIAMTLIQSANSIIGQAETLKRCVASTTVFPLSDVFKNCYAYLISLTTMYLFCLLFLIPFDPIILLLPVYLLPVVAIVAALAIAIAFLAPYVRDISEAMIIGMNVVFWLTPVIYPVAAVPEGVQAWFWLNPLFIMLHPVQSILYAHAAPSLGATLALWALTAIVVTGSYAVYRACRRNYVYYL